MKYFADNIEKQTHKENNNNNDSFFLLAAGDTK